MYSCHHRRAACSEYHITSCIVRNECVSTRGITGVLSAFAEVITTRVSAMTFVIQMIMDFTKVNAC